MANPAAMAMRRISPHRTCNRNSPRKNSRGGFTLVEVLVALVILAILVATAARGLLTSLASDEISAQIFAGTLAMNRLEAAAARGDDADKMQALAGSGWLFTETTSKATETNAIAWRVISLRSEIRPSLQLRTALRIPPPVPDIFPAIREDARNGSDNR